MKARFANKVAIVTGGSSGIGAATAARLAGEGATVVVADLNPPTGTGDAVYFHHCNVTVLAELEMLVKTTVERFGGLDILVNNAGIGSHGDVEALAPEDWERVFAINVSAIFYACKYAVPAMRARGGGAIVNVASISGISGDYGFGAYSASKGAVVNYTRTLALDAACDNIRVNALCPGAIADTAMRVGTHGSEQDQREWVENIPLGRRGLPAEMANVITFLASSEASYMTGAIIIADGGMTAHTGQPNVTRQRQRRLDAAAGQKPT
jgi:meso-butanediol dehydrogenase/(S,S)-butanediol dehydrogenase/diacetyl reductase